MAIEGERTRSRGIGRKSPVRSPKKRSMTVLIHLDNPLFAEAIRQLLITNRHHAIVVGEGPSSSYVTPDVLLVDITNLSVDVLARYAPVKGFLIDDACIEPQRVFRALRTCRAQGVPFPRAGLHQVWIERGSVKALRHHAGAMPIRLLSKVKRRSSSASSKGGAMRSLRGDLRCQTIRRKHLKISSESSHHEPVEVDGACCASSARRPCLNLTSRLLFVMHNHLGHSR